MTLDDFIKKFTNVGVDWDGRFGYQCVDLYRKYVNDVLGYPQSPAVEGAGDIWTNYLEEYYEKIPNTPTNVPQKGDVVIWNKRTGGGYGHVGIFNEGDTNRFTSFDQNWPEESKPHVQEHTYANVYGWLHPKKPVASDTALDSCMRDREKFWQERDSCYKLADELKQQIDGLKGEIETHKQFQLSLASKLAVENQPSVISGQIDQLLTCEDRVRHLQKDLQQANDTIQVAKAENERLTKDINEQKLALTTSETALKNAQEKCEAIGIQLTEATEKLTKCEILKKPITQYSRLDFLRFFFLKPRETKK